MMLPLLVMLCLVVASDGFFLGRPAAARLQLRMAVSEVTSTGGLDGIIQSAGDKLVVVDYSTTWCGPCKLVLPKYLELSDKYPQVTFLKCIGDASTEASALMKREGVRSVPTFHLWKGGNRVDVVNGARIEDVEAAVVNNMN
jgi:thioredoxin 1